MFIHSTENGIKYAYLCLPFTKTDKLTEIQIENVWKKFVKDKEYSKVVIEKRNKNNESINETMYFKNGKLHNEFNFALERFHHTIVERFFYLNGEQMNVDDESTWIEFVINWKRFKRLEYILKNDFAEFENI